MIWDENKINQLKILWRRGVSASEIAETLGISRNAVIGKGKRLGLNYDEGVITSPEDRRYIYSALLQEYPADLLIEVCSKRGISLNDINWVAHSSGLFLSKERNLFLPKGHVKKISGEEDSKKALYVSRDGQYKFRMEVLEQYNWTCAITGVSQLETLHAAHINPYAETKNHHASNGIALRADIHLLFDRGLISVHETSFSVLISSHMQDAQYKNLKGHKIKLPNALEFYPSAFFLNWHRENVFRE